MIEVDLRDNLDCQPCGLNLTEATARTAAMMGVFTGLGDVVPPNAGSFRRLTSAPARELRRRHPAATRRAAPPRRPTSRSSPASCVAVALGELGEGFGLAEIGRAQPDLDGGDLGHRPTPRAARPS